MNTEQKKQAILQQAQEYFERSCQQNRHYMYMTDDGSIVWIEEASDNLTHPNAGALLDVVGCGNHPCEHDDYIDDDGDSIAWYDFEPDAEKLLIKPLNQWESYMKQA